MTGSTSQVAYRTSRKSSPSQRDSPLIPRFWISGDECKSLAELMVDLAAVDAQILDHSPDAVKRRHRADSQKGPVPSIEDVTKSSMGFRSKLKERKLERIKQFGPIARSIAL